MRQTDEEQLRPIVGHLKQHVAEELEVKIAWRGGHGALAAPVAERDGP
jgi:hypothetical protein